MEFDKQPSSATPFSKKLTTNGGGLTGKHVYDGVFGGHRAKVGSGFEDYREIFGGSGACSIPILDVPELNESNKAWVDSQRTSSRLDYAGIFGGFGDADFGVGYEELFAKQKKVKKSSFKEARPPAEARPRSPQFEHSYSSEEKEVLSPNASFQSFDGVKQFNVSYHKANPGNQNGTNGTTHIAKLHAIPGYTHLIDETSPQQKGQGGNPVRSVFNDAHLNVNVTEGMKAGKPHRKAVSGPQPSGTAKNTPRTPTEFQKISSRNRSFSNDVSFDAFEIGLGTHPSTMPQPSISQPNLGNNTGVSRTSMNLKFGLPRSDASEGTAGSYSPPLLDEEVDANSAAAASAAAVRKAIEEAQAKIKIAKELMERKKEGLQNRGKLSFNNGLKAQKREVKTAERSSRSKEKEAQEMLENEDTPKQVFAVLSEHNAMKTSQVTTDFWDEKSSIAKSSVGETNSTESNSTQADTTLQEAEDGETTEEFFEPSGTEEEWEKALEFEQADNKKEITSSTIENERREKMTAEENIRQPKECDNKLKAFEEAPKQENAGRELNSVEGAFEWDMYANNIKSARKLHQEEKSEENISVHKHEEADKLLKVSYDQEKCENKLKKLQEPEVNAKFQIQELEKNEDVKELKEAHEWVETEKKQREAHNQEEKENIMDEVSRREENGRLDEIDEQTENEEEHKKAWIRVECEEQNKKGWNLEENEKKQNDALGVEETEEKSCEVYNEEVSKVRFNCQQDDEKSEQRLGEDGGKEGNKKLEEAKENEKIVKEGYQMNETEMRQEKNCEVTETESIQSEIYLRAEDEKNMDTTQQALRYQGNKLQAADDLYKLDENEYRGETDKSYGHKENFEDVEKSAEVHTVEKNEKIVEVTEISFLPGESGKESKTVDEAHGLEDEENVEAKGFTRLDGIKMQMADRAEAFVMGKNGVRFCETDLNFENKQNNHHVTEYKRVCNQEKCIEEMICELDESDEDANEPQIGINNQENKNNFGHFNGKRWLVNGIESFCDPEKLVEEVACELGENYKDTKEFEVVSNHEEDENSCKSFHDKRWVDNVIDIEARQQPCIFEWQGMAEEISQEEKTSQSTDKNEENHHETLQTEEREAKDILRKEGEVEKKCRSKEEEANESEMEKEKERLVVEISQEEKTSHSTDKNEENHHETLKTEEREAKDTLQKEGEVENKCRSKEEEAKEREMEKEKERLVVERAIREARERAFAEARERAERAAVERAATEAHQRLMAEAQERLEKTSAEANDKLAAEKASMEAKLKAERAAVERATAEARERALEKALSEKAAFKARNQAEKFAAEKFSGASKDDGIDSRDQPNNGPGPSSSSIYPSSSNHGVPYSTEKSTGGNGESAQRSKARLEMHQRTVERATIALAEKNMRDLLAQKEQAERNRLAETLDSDIRRWSSGKERNLRALLSTLHYILGPDSGWQSIPLTDLISTTAVKKAYRKATLFVHPDKLQQRGATIQQKYTCEKVFDLLKEAWNKFSAEER